MTRLRGAGILAALAVLVGVLAGLAVADPMHLRHARWFTSGFVLVALLLLTAALAVAVRGRVLRVLVLVVGGISVLGWCAVVGAAARLDAPSQQLTEVDEGGRRLIVLERTASGNGPVYAVVLRAGGGPFEQETVVYQGVEEAPAPADVRFVDVDTVEVRTEVGCRYRSEVESGTLAVEPVHRPLRATAC